MPDMTIEQAQERIMDLENQVAALTTERDTLKTSNDGLTNDLNHARRLNSQLLERVTEPEEPAAPDEPELPSWKDLAKTLK